MPPPPEAIARARARAADPSAPPEVRARLQELLQAHDERAAAGVADATAQRVSEVVQDEDVFAAKVRAARERPAPTSRSPEDVARARALDEAGSGAGQAMAGVEGGLRGMTLGMSDPAGAAITAAAHALTSDGGPQLTPEARERMAKLGIAAPEADSRSVWERGYDSAREQQGLRREANPVTAIASEIGGAVAPALLSGGTSALARGAQYMPSQLANRAGTAAAEKLVAPGFARAVLGSGLGAGLAGGTTAAVEGGDAGDVAGSALRGFGIGAGFGALTQGAKAGGAWMARKLRDPNTETGRALALAEEAGASTDTVERVRRGPLLEQLTEDARAAGPGIAPEALATERAAGELGETLAQRQSTTLNRASAQNQAQYAKGETASMAPTGRAALDELRRYTHADGRALPGVQLSSIADKVRGAGKVRVVETSSPEASMADPEDMMEVGLARNLGLLPRGGARAEDANKLVIFEWDQVGARQLDDTTRALSASAKEAGNVFSPATEPIKRVAAAARQNRSEFGPEWQATKAEQSSELGAMRDAFEASGLPRGLDDIDLGRFPTREDLFRAVSAYRTKSNLPADRELDAMAAGNRMLRELLDESAGARATAQLRGEPVDPKVAAGAGGLHTFGVGSGLRLRLDPTMRALANAQDSMPVAAAGAKAVPAAISAEAARERRRRGFR